MDKDMDDRRDWTKILHLSLMLITNIVIIVLAYANLQQSIALNTRDITDLKEDVKEHIAHPSFHNNMIKDNDLKYMTHKDGQLMITELSSTIELLTQSIKELQKDLKEVDDKLKRLK